MKNLFVLLFTLSIIILISSCKKDNAEKIDVQEYWDCNASQNYDSTKLAAKLIGSWQWAAQSCYWSGKTTKANKDVSVTFTASGSFSVTENSVVVTQGNWKLSIVDSGILGLDLDHSSEYLLGRILLCDSQVLFNDSYIDGCDNLFVRM